MPRLEFPNASHERARAELLAEWGAFEPIPTSPSRLFFGADFAEFLATVNDDLTALPPKVPSHLFFLVEDVTEKILWAIQIRHHTDHPNLIEHGGHIGYGVRPSERRKGYATEMLRLALPEAKKLGLGRVLITCSEDNVGSAKAIEANCGIFERLTATPDRDGDILRRYWIDLSE